MKRGFGWLAALALLPCAAFAQEREAEVLFTFERSVGGVVAAQEMILDGCGLTLVSAERIDGQEERRREALRLWLADWILAEAGLVPGAPDLAEVRLVLRFPPLPQYEGMYESALATAEGHLEAVRASGLGLVDYVAEANRLAEEIARRGIRGEFGALAQRNFVEGVEDRLGGQLTYYWRPVRAAALPVPVDRIEDAMVALAEAQRAGCF